VEGTVSIVIFLIFGRVNEGQNGMRRLQGVLEGFEREKVNEVEEAGLYYTKKIERQSILIKSLEAQNEQFSKRDSDGQKALERVGTLEGLVNEKNALIGQLRHDVLTLQAHLTQSMTHINATPTDVLDRQLISNLIVGFIKAERGTRKYEVVIRNFLLMISSKLLRL
jgi:GRAB domain